MKRFAPLFALIFLFLIIPQTAIFAQAIELATAIPQSANTTSTTAETVLAPQAVMVTLTQGVAIQAGALPISLTQLTQQPTTATLTPLLPTLANAVSPLGVAFTLQVDNSAETRTPTLALSLAYTTLPYEKYGASFQSRLQLAIGTACDLTTAVCADWQMLPTTHDPLTQQLTTSLSAEQLATPNTLYAAIAGVSGDQGNYGYTPLLSVADYQVNLNSGAFTTQYPILVPPARAGNAPQIALSYNSGVVDGMHNDKNNQPGPVGLGWSFNNSFITRHLKSCSITDKTLCSDRNRYTITLNGVSSRLILLSGNQYRLQSDPYWRVERVSATSSNNDGEMWHVTTPDGMQYRFGGTADSVFYVPVDGTAKAWQWNLDLVTDPNGNKIQYEYELETNHYKHNGVLTPYIQAGQLKTVSYSFDDNGNALAQVRFLSAGRCLNKNNQGILTATECPDQPNETYSFPDTPVELNCSSTDVACTQTQPTFWSRSLIREVVSEGLVNGSWSQVAEYLLSQQFSPLDEALTSEQKLWLAATTRTGFPSVNYGSTVLQNRHDVNAGVSPVQMRRVNKVTNELGGVIEVTYGQSHPVVGNNCAGTNGNIHLAVDCFVTTLAIDGVVGTAYWNKWKVLETKRYNNFPSSLGLTATETARYEYSAPAWHFNEDPGEIDYRHWNDYRGSDVVRVYDAENNVTEYRFFRGMEGDRVNAAGGWYSANLTLSDGSTLTDSNWLAGRLAEVSQYNSSNVRLAHTVLSYTETKTTNNTDSEAPYNANAYFVGVSQTKESADSLKTSQTRTHYDSYGNPDTIYEDGDTSTSADDRHLVTSYQYDTTRYIVNRPSSEILRAGTTSGAGAIASQTDYTYDSNGNVTSIKRYSDATNYAETQYEYDSLGRVTVQHDPNDNVTNSSYHPMYGYVESVTNAKNQTTHFVVDPRWGVVTQTTDPNGLVTKQNYDQYGRLTQVYAPDQTGAGAPATITYQYTVSNTVPSHVRTGQLTNAAGAGTYLYSWVFMDGFGRTVQTQKSSPTGGSFAAQTQAYDERGLLQYETPVYDVSGTAGNGYERPIWSEQAGYTGHSYDALGRVTRSGWYSGITELWASTQSYSGWQTTLTDAKEQTTTQSADAFGQLVAVRDATNNNTTYQYNLLGGLTLVTDSANSQTTMNYDWLGRKTSMSDPDMGSWYYQYDPVGNLIAQVDAKGQATHHYYDALNRLTEKSYATNISNPAGYTRPALGNAAVTYVYDETAYGKAIGQVTRILDGSGSVAYFYEDGRGRLTRETRWITDAPRTFTQKYSYDSADRPITVTYPDGEVVTTTYNLQSQPLALQTTIGVLGKLTYVNYSTYNVRGQLTSMYYNNGAHPAHAVGILQEYHGPEEAFRLKTINTTRNGVPFFKGTYDDYDLLGNILQEAVSYQGGANETNNFSYDALSRLTGVTGGYARNYSYNAIGNITNFNGTAYSYSPTKPHAVTQAGINNYEYDANGNMTKRTEGGESYTQSFDMENRLTQVQKAGERWTFAYDAAGQRRKAMVYNGANQLQKVIFYPFATYEWEMTTTAEFAQTDPNLDNLPAGNDVISILGDLKVIGVPTAVSGMKMGLAKGLPSLLLLWSVGLLFWLTLRYRHKGLWGLVLLVGLMGSASVQAQTAASDVARSHYLFNGRVVATRTKTSSSNTVEYLHHDRLGSTVMRSTQAGVVIAESITKYEPFGGYRTNHTNKSTIGYTGHRHNDELGLIYMNARYYVPGIGRFASADSIVPAPANPQSFNRYSYVGNNPLNGTDPDGHCYPVCTAAIGAGIGGAIGGGVQLFQNYRAGVPLTTDLGKAVVVGAVAGAVSGVTFGAGTAVLGTGAIATIASGSLSGVVAGQATIATTNIWNGQAITSGLGNPADIGRDALIGGTFAGVGYGANRAIINWRSAQQNLVREVDPRIKLALLELEKSGLRPGQTEISQGKILRLVENFDSIQANSIIYKSTSGTNYLVDGHHTTVASTIIQKSGVNMGQRALLPPEELNAYWTKHWWEFGKKTIQIYR